MGEEGGEGPAEDVGAVEAVGWKNEVGGVDALTERESGDQGCYGGDDVRLSESRDDGFGGEITWLPDRDYVAGFGSRFVRGKCRGCRNRVLYDIIPDTDAEPALGRVRYSGPVHVTVGFVDNRGQDAEILALASYLVYWQRAGFTDQSVGTDEFQKLVYLFSWQVVREEDGCETVESAG